MEFKWLEDFLSVASTGSFSKSAELRNVTQPAFSRRIKSLELWLGVDLIDRSTFPTRLTKEGLAFKETAEEVLGALLVMRNEFLGRNKVERAALSFTSLHTLSVTFFPRWVSDIARDGYTVPCTRMSARDLHDCVHALQDGQSDFMLSYMHDCSPLLLDANEYPSITLSEEEFVAVSSVDEQGRARYDPTREGGAPVPFIRFSSNCLLGRVMEYIITRTGCSQNLHTVYENSMSEAIKAMIVEGAGFGWVPRNSINADLEANRLKLIAPDRFSETLRIQLFRSVTRSRPTLERFWQFVKNS